MKLRVNGEDQELPDGLTVAGLLDELAIDRRQVAVEVNREIVPKSLHEGHLLAEGDRVEIVTMVGGG